MSKITYALPAFAGHLTADDRNRINAISRKALRRGVTHTAFDIAEIINKFDRKLFSQIIHPGHCLYHLLPPKTPAHCRYSLRERQHSFQLSNIEFSQFKNSYINRCLFKFRWSILLYTPCAPWVYVHIVRIVRIVTLHFILCDIFYVLSLHIVTACAWHVWLKGYLSYLIYENRR